MPGNFEEFIQRVERDIQDFVDTIDRLLERPDGEAEGVVEGPAPCPPRPLTPAKPAGHTYDLAFLNTDLDWPSLLPRLSASAQGSFLFYGLPGTGKSALAKEIARRLRRPLLLCRGSDLLSRYVGDTENKIAGIFREAEGRNAVLVIDEIDGMLFDRADAARSWELTRVNEMLCQMEDFHGLFIATTNGIDWLDPACLRRFSIKCEFRALRAEQCLALFRRWCTVQRAATSGRRAKTLDGELLRRLGGLNGITPGDFAAAVRRLALFDAQWTPESLCQQLEAESRLKPGQSRPIGFIR